MTESPTKKFLRIIVCLDQERIRDSITMLVDDLRSKAIDGFAIHNHEAIYPAWYRGVAGIMHDIFCTPADLHILWGRKFDEIQILPFASNHKNYDVFKCEAGERLNPDGQVIELSTANPFPGL